MYLMFCESKFAGDISNWNVSNVLTMDSMFNKSEFTGDISNWKIPKVKELKNFHNNEMKLSMEILLKITPYMR